MTQRAYEVRCLIGLEFYQDASWAWYFRAPGLVFVGVNGGPPDHLLAACYVLHYAICTLTLVYHYGAAAAEVKGGNGGHDVDYYYVRWMDGGWMDGWMDGWMGGWVGGWASWTRDADMAACLEGETLYGDSD